MAQKKKDESTMDRGEFILENLNGGSSRKFSDKSGGSFMENRAFSGLIGAFSAPIGAFSGPIGTDSSAPHSHARNQHVSNSPRFFFCIQFAPK